MHPDEILRKLNQCPDLLNFQTSLPRAFVLVAQLQLALRHPNNSGAGAALAREIAMNLSEAIYQFVPEARELLEMGWNPGYDVSHEYFEAEFPTMTSTTQFRNDHEISEEDERDG